MKYLSKLIYLLTLTLIIGSCADSDNDEVTIIGGGEDTIILSTNNIEFDALQNSATVTTEGEYWSIAEITVNDIEFGIPENINVTADSYAFKQDCITIDKKNDNTINIQIDENLSGIEKIISIDFMDGNFHDRVIIKQLAN